jgi:RHS repeat-associated protein
VTATALVDAGASGSSTTSPRIAASQTSVVLSSAAGSPIASATLAPGGWALAGIVRRDQMLGASSVYAVPSLISDPLTLAPGQLPSSAALVASSSVNGVGLPISQTQILNSAELLHQVNFSPTPATLGMSITSTEVGTQCAGSAACATTSLVDIDGRLRHFTDEAGKSGTYSYDSLGRLSSIALPNGTSISLAYDEHSRIVQTTRGSLTIAYEYDEGTGLLRSKTTSVSHAVQQYEFFDYDGIGRISAHIFSDATGASKKPYLYFYDGKTLDNDIATPSQLGFLSGVPGPDYTKSFVYRPDGQLAESLLNVRGERAVLEDFDYFDDGSMRLSMANVLSPQTSGQACLNQGETKIVQVDSFGRPVELDVNGAPLAVVSYDTLGRVDSVALSDGSMVRNLYDPYTLQQSGFARLTPAQQNFESSFTLNNRGLVDSEVQGSALGTVVRQYGYSAQGFLATSEDQSSDAAQSALHNYSYGFDAASGLPTSIATDGVIATPVNNTNDALGRTTARAVGGVTTNYVYGPDGQVAHVSSNANAADYIYDESGLRLGKVKNNALTVYTDTGVLDDTGLTEPLSIAGVHIGTLHKGAFTALATDIRGTVLSAPVTSSGATSNGPLPSPFGARLAQPDVASVTDFIEQPFDADMGLVRLGVRDYDPQANRFIEPDALYLAAPELCLGDHVGCNLYSYASNNPVNFVDPSGLNDIADPCEKDQSCAGGGNVSVVDMPTETIVGDAGPDVSHLPTTVQNIPTGPTLANPGAGASIPLPMPGGGVVVSGGGAGGGGYGAGPTIHPGPLGYAGMIPGGIATGALYNGGSYTIQGLNNIYAVASAGTLLFGLGRLGFAALSSEGAASLAGQSFWGRAATLADHFLRHGAGVGASTAEEYAQGASSLFVRSQVEGLPTKIDAAGVIRVYDPANNWFGSFNPNGTTRTFFAPEPALHGYPTNLDYWNAQPGVSPWFP